jgi:hypothetical protein
MAVETHEHTEAPSARWAQYPNEHASQEGLSAAATVILAWRHLFAGKYGTSWKALKRCFRGSMSRKTFKAAIRELQRKGLWDRKQVGGRYAKETLASAKKPRSYRRVEQAYFDRRFTWKEVAALLYVRANSYCSASQVARRFGWDRRSAQRYLETVIDLGLVTKEGTLTRPLYRSGQDAEIAADAKAKFKPRSVQGGVRRNRQPGVRRSVQPGVRNLTVNLTVGESRTQAASAAANLELQSRGIEAPSPTVSAGSAPKQLAEPARGLSKGEPGAAGGVPTVARSLVDRAHEAGAYGELMPRLARIVTAREASANPIRDPDAYAAKMIANANRDALVRCNLHTMVAQERPPPRARPPAPPIVVPSIRGADVGHRYDKYAGPPTPGAPGANDWRAAARASLARRVNRIRGLERHERPEGGV